jgi:DNA-binding GntR family transcriptional regulator
MVIPELPMPDDIDADYSPQYVKLARILRTKITSGGLGPLKIIRACDLNEEYGVSVQVAHATLDMLAANGYLGRPDNSRSYKVTWNAADARQQPV